MQDWNQYQVISIWYIRIAIMDDYHYVYHRETDEQAFRLQSGEFEGVVWKYNEVKFPLEGVDLEEIPEIPLTFEYEVLYNISGVVDEESVERFDKVIGDILMNVIEEGLEHDQIKIRNNDTEQLDS